MNKKQRVNNNTSSTSGYLLLSPQVKSQQIIRERQQQYQEIIATSYFNKDRSPRSEFVKKSKPIQQSYPRKKVLDLITFKIEISENITPFDSFKSTTLDLLNSVRFKGSFVDTNQLEQEMQELNNDKTELIRLQKMKIKELEEMLAEQQKEIEKLRLMLKAKESKRASSQEQTKSYTSSVQDMPQRIDLLNLINHIRTETKTLQEGRDQIKQKETKLKLNLKNLNDTQKSIVNREIDSQRQQIKLNEYRKELQDWSVQLIEKEKEMSSREQNLVKQEQYIQQVLHSLNNHTSILNNLQTGLGDEIQNLRGWDENVFRKLLKKYSTQSPTGKNQLNFLNDSLLIQGI